MVTDTGGIDDQVVQRVRLGRHAEAQSDGKAKVSYVQSSRDDYKTNISKLESQNCKLIVTSVVMGDATTAAPRPKPSQYFAESDYFGNGTNLQGLQFNTAQGAFLAAIWPPPISKTASWPPTAV